MGVGKGYGSGGAESLILLFLFFGGALIVGGWDAMGLGRKSYLGQAEITCFFLFRDVRVSSRFPCVIPWVERFSLDIYWAVKKCRKCVLEVGCIGEGVE